MKGLFWDTSRCSFHCSTYKLMFLLFLLLHAHSIKLPETLLQGSCFSSSSSSCLSISNSFFVWNCFLSSSSISPHIIIHLANFSSLNWPQSSLIQASIAGLPNITIQSSLGYLLYFLFHKHHIAISIVSSTNQYTSLFYNTL